MKNIDFSSKIRILICCHKQYQLPPNPKEIFLPIQVGASIAETKLNMQGDDNIGGFPCENISAKNKNYCELTAMYWAWKNIKKLYPDLQYIGLCHYRRYFSFNKRNYFDDAIIIPESKVKKYSLNVQKLEEYLKKYDCIIPQKRVYPYSLEIDYSVNHQSEDLRTLNRLVHDLSSDYNYAYNDVIIQNNKLSHYNMFIMSWENFNSYCTWLFKILGQAEKNIDISSYNSIQARIWGYMAERLFNVWLYKNKLKIKYLNIIKFDNAKSDSHLRQFKKLVKNTLAFNIATKPLGLGRFKKKLLSIFS